MIVYGTEIYGDFRLPAVLESGETEARHRLELSSALPETLRHAVTCGFLLYRAHGREVYLYSDRPFDGSDAGQPWRYEVKDVVSFYWRGGERTVYCEPAPGTTAELLAFWFVHLQLPLYWTLEGAYEFLHGGSVEIDGRAVVFTAPSMGGKSTLTDFFVRQGHVLISDDKIATYAEEGSFMLVGSHPLHRPYRKFEDLGLRAKNYRGSPQEIHAVYCLEKLPSDGQTEIEEIRGFSKFDALLPHYLYRFPFLVSKRMRYLSGLTNRIRVFRVRRPWDMKRLPEVYRVITEHSRRL